LDKLPFPPEILESLSQEFEVNRIVKHFTYEMTRFCGKRLRVRSQMHAFIEEGTGTMRKLKNTVMLEGAYCDSASWAFGGCPRSAPLYWRELWLKRVQPEKSKRAVSSVNPFKRMHSV
jgi:hypothetical protein